MRGHSSAVAPVANIVSAYAKSFGQIQTVQPAVRLSSYHERSSRKCKASPITRFVVAQVPSKKCLIRVCLYRSLQRFLKVGRYRSRVHPAQNPLGRDISEQTLLIWCRNFWHRMLPQYCVASENSSGEVFISVKWS